MDDPYISSGSDEIYIGGYTIKRLGDNEFWITNDYSEGMQTTEEKLTQAIKEFWDREF